MTPVGGRRRSTPCFWPQAVSPNNNLCQTAISEDFLYPPKEILGGPDCWLRIPAGVPEPPGVRAGDDGPCRGRHPQEDLRRQPRRRTGPRRPRVRRPAGAPAVCAEARALESADRDPRAAEDSRQGFGAGVHCQAQGLVCPAGVLSVGTGQWQEPVRFAGGRRSLRSVVFAGQVPDGGQHPVKPLAHRLQRHRVAALLRHRQADADARRPPRQRHPRPGAGVRGRDRVRRVRPAHGAGGAGPRSPE